MIGLYDRPIGLLVGNVSAIANFYNTVILSLQAYFSHKA